MHRFFFDIHDGEPFLHDEDGQELATLEHARTEALLTLAALLRDQVVKLNCRELAANVRDETGRVIFTANLSLRERWPEPGS